MFYPICNSTSSTPSFIIYSVRYFDSAWSAALPPRIWRVKDMKTIGAHNHLIAKGLTASLSVISSGIDIVSQQDRFVEKVCNNVVFFLSLC